MASEGGNGQRMDLTKWMLAALLALVMGFGSLLYDGMAGDIDHNEEGIDENHVAIEELGKVVTSIEANQRADARVQATQTDVLGAILVELKKED